MCRKIHAGNIMLVAITVLITCSCGSKRKLEELCNNNIAAGVTIAENMAMEELRDSTLDAAPAEKIASTLLEALFSGAEPGLTIIDMDLIVRGTCAKK